MHFTFSGKKVNICLEAKKETSTSPLIITRSIKHLNLPTDVKSEINYLYIFLSSCSLYSVTSYLYLQFATNGPGEVVTAYHMPIGVPEASRIAAAEAQPHESRPDLRIVGGLASYRGEHPFMVTTCFYNTRKLFLFFHICFKYLSK